MEIKRFVSRHAALAAMYMYFAVIANAVFAFSPGSASDAVMLRDINPGSFGSNISNLVPVGNLVFFDAYNGTGKRLWITDGTSSGTLMLEADSAGSDPLDPLFITKVQNRVFFAAKDTTNRRKLWVSDGTNTGTKLVTTATPGTFGNTTFHAIGALGPQALFLINGTGPELELWKSDGTAAGTVIVKNLGPFSTSISSLRFSEWNGLAFFFFRSDSLGEELWVSDGTAAGTHIVKDIYPNSDSSYPAAFLPAGNYFYFAAIGPFSTFTYAPWRTDGTSAETKLIREFGASFAGGGGSPVMLNNGTVLFSGSDGSSESQLFRTDGTSSGTVPVQISEIIARNVSMTKSIGDYAVFIGSGSVLWCTDGANAGTYPIPGITVNTSSGFINGFTRVNQTAYFYSSDPTHGSELWMTDGTVLGTKLVKDILPGSGTSTGFSFVFGVGFEDSLVFLATDGVHGIELWHTIPDQFSASSKEWTLYE